MSDSSSAGAIAFCVGVSALLGWLGRRNLRIAGASRRGARPTPSTELDTILLGAKGAAVLGWTFMTVAGLLVLSALWNLARLLW